MGTNLYWNNVYWNQALSGRHAFDNLVRLSAEILARNPDVVFSNVFQIMDADVDLKSSEAIVRRIWTARPTARQLVVLMPECDAGLTEVLALSAVKANAKAMYEAYSIPVIDFDNYCRNHVGDLAILMSDPLHPSAAGQTQIATMVEGYLTANPTFLTVAPNHTTLPARVIAGSDVYENTPQRISGRLGTETGTGWADAGTTARQSSTAGDTTSFTVTCSNFGILTNVIAGVTVEVSIDGGAYADYSGGPNGYAPTLARAEHTITIRVKAGTTFRIDEFWAV